MDYICENQVEYVADRLAKIIAELFIYPKIAERLLDAVEYCLRKRNADCIREEDIYTCFTEDFEECLKEAVRIIIEEYELDEKADFEIKGLKYECIDKERELATNADNFVKVQCYRY